jgi:hypothetical protein
LNRAGQLDDLLKIGEHWNGINSHIMAEEIKSESPYLPGYESSKILRPSFAYTQACLSYPCKVSEMVFGSLLASYILGLLTAGPEMRASDHPICSVLMYLSISCSFSFLTATLYTVYHNSILTMPNVPLSDLTTDFALAIGQAVAFGISVIFPATFCFCIGLVLLSAFWRQEMKFRALAEFFYDRLGIKMEDNSSKTTSARETIKSKPEKIRHLFREKVRPIPSLDGWGPVRTWQYVGAVALVAVGVWIFLIHLDYMPIPVPHQFKDTFQSQSPTIYNEVYNEMTAWGIIYGVVSLFVFLGTWKILKKKSIALEEDGRRTVERMDLGAKQLADAITKPKTS